MRACRGQTSNEREAEQPLYELKLFTDVNHATVEAWNSVVRSGVTPRWLIVVETQTDRSKKHSSINNYAASIFRHLPKGQRDRQYLILYQSCIEFWRQVYIRPIGVVDIGDGADTRVINDYFIPMGSP